MYARAQSLFFSNASMPKKTLKELRAAARTRDLRGNSKLSRGELEKLLSLPGRSTKTVPEKPGKARARKIAAGSGSPASPPPVHAKKSRASSRRAKTAEPIKDAPKWKWGTVRSPDEEERVERAKYTTNLAGQSSPSTTENLYEDIDNLPPIIEPMLCLLPQKPGVLHGYWIAPPGAVPSAQSLKLRFGRITNDTFEVLEEIPLSRERGHWYFRVDESTDVGAVYLQLGYYEPDGRFVNAIRRGIARVPDLHASERTDRLWWVGEEQFRAMYRRAGGKVSGARLGWTASIGSPGGVPSSRK